MADAFEDSPQNVVRVLSTDDQDKLSAQNSRIIPEGKARKLEQDAKRHWDLFYKRNETRFFKDRRWTTREFEDLHSDEKEHKRILEVGCGVGNLVFPLIAERPNYFVFACDFSPRAVALVKQNSLYDETLMKVFEADITTERIFKEIPEGTIDVISLVFVLSAIHPDKFAGVLSNLYRLLRPGGCVVFRDYGLYDMAQLRFKPGHKIADNFYMRQDGTRSFFFSTEQLATLFETAGFETAVNGFVHRRTVNVKENVDAPRIFVQAKFTRPFNSDSYASS